MVARPSVRQRSRGPWRIILSTVLLILILIAVFYGVGGWYFSGEIYSGAIQVQPPETPEFNVALDRGEAEAVVLRGDSSGTNLLADGRFGLMWESGESLVDGILSAETSGGTSTVFRQRVAGEAIPPPGTAVRLDSFVWSGDPQTALGIPFTEIEYPVERGEAGAWYVDGTSNTWMIFIHGKGAPRNEALRLLPLAVERGYHAMVIDYRNDPGAPPDPSGTYQYGLTEWQDVAAAARYARSNGAQDLIMVGYSMGGANVVSYLLESPLRAQTAAVILDSPVLDFGSAVDHAAEATKLPLTPISVPPSLTSFAKWIAGWRFDIDWDATNYVSRWRDLQTPMLIFQGTGDETVPLAPAQELAGRRPDTITLLTPARVGHVLAWNADASGYEDSITTFLDELGL